MTKNFCSGGKFPKFPHCNITVNVAFFHTMHNMLNFWKTHHKNMSVLVFVLNMRLMFHLWLRLEKHLSFSLTLKILCIKVWSKKFETHNLLYCRKTIKFTKMNFKSADTLGIRLSEMVQYITVPIIVLEISKKMFQTHFFKIPHSCF